MRPVSQTYLNAIRGSHRMVSRAVVCDTYQNGPQPNGFEIPIIAGDVSMAAGSDVRATLDLATHVGEWSTRPEDLLTPYGNEIFVSRGIAYGNGTTEWVGLGYFRIQSVEQDQAPDGPLRISGVDRMQGLADSRLLAPVQFDAGSSIGAIFTALANSVYPGLAAEVDDPEFPSTTLARALVAEEDRVGFLRDLVASYGKIMYFDHRGFLVVKAPPAPGSPVFTVDHGAGGVLMQLARSLTRDGVYNAVVAVGEGVDTEEPVRAVAVDNNPNSPTYWSGKFGQVPRFYSSPFITTTAQAASAAAAMLARSVGLPYSADLSAVPNVALEPWDPIKIKYPGRYEHHILDTLTIPLTPDAPLTATTREKLTVVIGGDDDA